MPGEGSAPAPNPQPSSPEEWAELVYRLPKGSEEQFRAFQQFLKALDDQRDASA